VEPTTTRHRRFLGEKNNGKREETLPYLREEKLWKGISYFNVRSEFEDTDLEDHHV